MHFFALYRELPPILTRAQPNNSGPTVAAEIRYAAARLEETWIGSGCSRPKRRHLNCPAINSRRKLPASPKLPRIDGWHFPFLFDAFPVPFVRPQTGEHATYLATVVRPGNSRHRSATPAKVTNVFRTQIASNLVSRDTCNRPASLIRVLLRPSSRSPAICRT